MPAYPPSTSEPGPESLLAVRDETDVEPRLCELQGKLFADAVDGACDHRPAAFGSILAELATVALVAGSMRRWELKSCAERKYGELTLVPLKINSNRNAFRNLRPQKMSVSAPRNARF
jgi:hypothetical protein